MAEAAATDAAATADSDAARTAANAATALPGTSGDELGPGPDELDDEASEAIAVLARGGALGVTTVYVGVADRTRPLLFSGASSIALPMAGSADATPGIVEFPPRPRDASELLSSKSADELPSAVLGGARFSMARKNGEGKAIRLITYQMGGKWDTATDHLHTSTHKDTSVGLVLPAKLLHRPAPLSGVLGRHTCAAHARVITSACE